MQNPNHPSKQVEQEKPRKKGRTKPNPRHQGSRRKIPFDLKTLREPAAGKTAQAAGPEEEHGTWEKTKWRSKEPSNSTPGVDQQAEARHADAPGKGAEPQRGSSGRGSCAGTREKPQGVNRTSVLRHPQPHAKPSPQE